MFIYQAPILYKTSCWKISLSNNPCPWGSYSLGITIWWHSSQSLGVISESWVFLEARWDRPSLSSGTGWHQACPQNWTNSKRSWRHWGISQTSNCNAKGSALASGLGPWALGIGLQSSRRGTGKNRTQPSDTGQMGWSWDGRLIMLSALTSKKYLLSC